MHKHSRSAQIARLAELLRKMECGMFTTINEDGTVTNRPVIVQDSEFDGVIRFFITRLAGKVDAIQTDSHVNMSFMDPSSSRYLSMSGTAEVISDPKLMKKFWSANFEKWFPAGLSQEDLVLISVYITFAEFWDTPNSEVAQIFCFMTEDTSKPKRPQLSVSL